MKLERTGLIIFAENFEECISFYKNLFDLNVLFEERSEDFNLTCFELGQGHYLMIETPDANNVPSLNAPKLRFNVGDIQAASKRLEEFGVVASIRHRDWGSTIDILDPAGNKISIRDEKSFLSQIKTGP